MAGQEHSLYRLRTANGAAYASGAYGYRRSGILDKLAEAFLALLRAAAAIAVLTGWVIGIFLYHNTPVNLFGIGAGWLTLAHLLVPVGFFCLALTNRRYGPGYAFTQLAGTAAAVAGFVFLAGPDINAFAPLDSIPSVREACAFAGAFFVASLVSITVFDGARGPLWWMAPLFGFLAAAIVFSAVFFPWLYAGSSDLWIGNGLEFMGVLAGEGLLLLLPFWALRRLVPPMSGFGGY